MKPLSAKIDPRVKDVLLLLGAGTFLAAALFMPGIPMLLKPFIDKKHRDEQNEWKKFNTWRLRQVLKRMHDQKLITIEGEGDNFAVTITEKGKKRLLTYDLETMQLQHKKWDGKWRIIIYDIFSTKKRERETFRRMLKKLQFYPLQKSVYLTAFPCQNEIEYLRQIYSINGEVLVLTVSNIEGEEAYKEYFGIPK